MHYIYIISYMNIFIYHNKSQREYWTALKAALMIHSYPHLEGLRPCWCGQRVDCHGGARPQSPQQPLGWRGVEPREGGKWQNDPIGDIVGLCGIIVGHMIGIRLEWDEYSSNMIK